MTECCTEQEAFWAGHVGREYARRNNDPAIIASNASLFAQALRRFGIEINPEAAEKRAALIGEINVQRGSKLKRDFAGEMLDWFSQLRLADYGFGYRRDPAFPQDDVTWLLLEKPAS